MKSAAKNSDESNLKRQKKNMPARDARWDAAV
jgi:hypothetical protein